MAVQSPLTEPTEHLRLEILTQAGVALASLERATASFEAIHRGVVNLPGALDLQKSIRYLREQQLALKESLNRIATLFEPVPTVGAHEPDPRG